MLPRRRQRLPSPPTEEERDLHFEHDYRAAQHRALVESWRPPEGRWPQIDVLLPVAGEPLALLENTWAHVSALAWDGPIAVYVGDDLGDSAVAELAQRYGFRYLNRTDPGWTGRAGNLRHLYRHGNGEFALVLDADCCPRADFLRELMPYFEEGVGVVQSRTCRAGTNAIHRRQALDESPTPFGLDEDAQMGWGWRLRYVPVVLAAGLRPD